MKRFGVLLLLTVGCAATAHRPAPPIGLDRPEGAVRIVSWDLAGGLDDADRSSGIARILAALDADVMLLSGLGSRDLLSALPDVRALSPRFAETMAAGPAAGVFLFGRHPSGAIAERGGSAAYLVELRPTYPKPLLIVAVGAGGHASGQEFDELLMLLRAAKAGRGEIPLDTGTPMVFLDAAAHPPEAQDWRRLQHGEVAEPDRYGPSFAPDWQPGALAEVVLGGRSRVLASRAGLRIARLFELRTETLDAAVLAKRGLLRDDSTRAGGQRALVVDVAFEP